MRSPLGRREGRRHGEPVRALERERSPRIAAQAPPHGVLPVRRVQDLLGDRVPVGMRTPSRLPGRQAPDGSPEVRAVPGMLVVGFVNQANEDRHFAGEHRIERLIWTYGHALPLSAWLDRAAGAALS